MAVRNKPRQCLLYRNSDDRCVNSCGLVNIELYLLLLRLNCAIVKWKIYYRFIQDIYSLYVYRRNKYDQRGNGFSAVLYDILGSHCNEYEGYCNLVCDAVWYDTKCFGITFVCSADDRGRGFLRKVGTFGQTTRVMWGTS